MTAPDLTTARLEELLAAATPGPWRAPTKNTGHVWGVDNSPGLNPPGTVEVAQVGAYRDKELLRWNRARWDADKALIALSPSLAARVIELEAEAKAERLRLASAALEALVIDVEGADQDGPMVGWEYTATGMRFTIRGALAAALAAHLAQGGERDA